uniref:Uncharacterized protein n=1 Tax=Timema monikensis TaxID=170555 RepID=A0A7R9DZN6_9NEOP|nr:unnamed protein product [Timema monikensis]
MRLIRVKRHSSSATATPASSTVTSVSLSSGSAMAILGRLSSAVSCQSAPKMPWGYCTFGDIEYVVSSFQTSDIQSVKVSVGGHVVHTPSSCR